jgi:hypothetical protein
MLPFQCSLKHVTCKNIVEGATQVSGHSLKLHFCMFERSQGEHNSLDYRNFF